MQKRASSKATALHRLEELSGSSMASISRLVEMTNFDVDSLDNCTNMGYLPTNLKEELVVAKFLARTVLAAQYAQRIYGVPASILIAIAMQKSGYEADDLVKKPRSATKRPKGGASSPGILEWFIKTASQLAGSRKDRGSTEILMGAKYYLDRFCALGLGDDLDAQDVLNNIEVHELEECDEVGLLPPGEFSREKFEVITDVHGARHIELFWARREKLEREKSQLSASDVESLMRQAADRTVEMKHGKRWRGATIAYDGTFDGIYLRAAVKLGVTIEHIRDVVKGVTQDIRVSAELEREIGREFPVFCARALVA